MSSAVDGLDLEHIHVWRGDRHVLRGVGLTVSPGELLHICGANGTGKTTLLRVASGLLRPEQGSVSWRGCPILRSRQEFHSELAYAAHEPALKGDLTALENLQYSVGLRRRVAVRELRRTLDSTGVAACADLPARVLSAGQRRRVTMARVLALGATLWLLDEPFTNLDDDGAGMVRGLLEQHVARGGLALVTAHHELDVRANRRRLALDA